ncbi:MAG TPA: PqqD family protein [Actinomycetota bacterium]|nr:PqqD family protein [Actinomycetota bacterium]
MESLKLRDADVVWREVEGEVVAFDMRSSNYLSVNRAGACLWPMLAKGATTESLVSRLAETFGLTDLEAQTDVAAFVAELRSKGLLETE